MKRLKFINIGQSVYKKGYTEFNKKIAFLSNAIEEKLRLKIIESESITNISFVFFSKNEENTLFGSDFTLNIDADYGTFQSIDFFSDQVNYILKEIKQAFTAVSHIYGFKPEATLEFCKILSNLEGIENFELCLAKKKLKDKTIKIMLIYDSNAVRVIEQLFLKSELIKTLELFTETPGYYYRCYKGKIINKDGALFYKTNEKNEFLLVQ